MRGSALIYLEEHNEYLFKEHFQMYFIFVRALPGIMPWSPFFNFYSSKIFDIVGHHLPKVHCHADDSQLYLSINPSCAFSQDKAIRSMETCISDVKQWMTSDKLILNDDKTEFIVIASQHLLKKAAVKIIIIIIKYLYSAYTFQC